MGYYSGMKQAGDMLPKRKNGSNSGKY